MSEVDLTSCPDDQDGVDLMSAVNGFSDIRMKHPSGTDS